MAGGACKIIINNGMAALSKSIETILTNPDIHTNRLDEDKRYELIQRQADCDLALYKGHSMPDGGLGGILLELESLGIVTDEVWQIYAKPETISLESPESPEI